MKQRDVHAMVNGVEVIALAWISRREIRSYLQATRDYAVGEAAHPATSAAAQALGIELPPQFAARKFDYTNDTVHFDMILVMDKFTAGDVMREVGVLYSIAGTRL